MASAVSKEEYLKRYLTGAQVFYVFFICISLKIYIYIYIYIYIIYMNFEVVSNRRLHLSKGLEKTFYNDQI